MPKPYSLDLRKKAIAQIDAGKKIREVAEMFSIAENTLRNWLSLREDTKSLSPKDGYQKGHSHKFKDLEYFKKFADEHSGESFESMAQAYGGVSDTTVGRMMKKIGILEKKDFWIQRTGCRKKREIHHRSLVEGSCSRKVFEVYLEKVLVPELQPGQTIILDNASFHKGGHIRAIIESAQCHILYLPAYSPDFNPIENRWAPIKNTIRKQLPLCDRDLYKAAEVAFQ